VTPLDEIWIDVARRLDVPVVRDDDFGYVHWDGRTLHLATDGELDDDDTLAQLVLHELCHALVQGADRFRAPDWGLDNTTNDDEDNERAALRLQAHLTGAFGLRDRLFPTTVVRPFYESLGRDAFLPVEEVSSQRARVAATTMNERFGGALKDALARSAALLGVPRQPTTALPMWHRADGVVCGGCAWRTDGGMCRAAATRVFVGADEAGCARFEAALDCQACGACCREAYDAVDLGPREPVLRRHPSLVVRDGDRAGLRRAHGRCAALGGDGPYTCAIYDDRPRTCRDFTRSGRHCLDARRRVGLSV
jgi:hypothetical protein